MFRSLNKWFSFQSQIRRPRRPAAFRPALESLERRDLPSASAVVNSMVNEDFVAYSDGVLRKIDHNFLNLKTRIDSNVASLSVSTDASGRGMAAYLKRDGTACVWTDTNGPEVVSLAQVGVTNSVKAVCAGQGGRVFVQDSGNYLWEFDTHDGTWWYLWDSVASFSSGTDSRGNTTYALVKTNGTAFEASINPNTSYGTDVWFNWQQLCNPAMGITSNIKSVAAGQHGVTFVLLTSGVLYQYNQAGNTWGSLGGNVASVIAGVNYMGDTMADIVTLTGQVWENSDTHPWDGDHGLYRQLVPPGTTGTNPKTIRSVTANTGDLTDVVLSDGSLLQYNDRTRQWTMLDTGVA
jgi:hypothetical protein